MAPGGAYENFTTKSDVFSLGMILHFMCFGKLPYVGADSVNEENEDLDALREEISAWQGLDERDKIRTDLPERLYHSLKTLINPDPKLRPSAEDILAGIKGNIGEEASPVCLIIFICTPLIGSSDADRFRRRREGLQWMRASHWVSDVYHLSLIPPDLSRQPSQ